MGRCLSVFLLIITCGCAFPEHYTRENSQSVDVVLYLPGVEKVVFLSSLDGFKEHDLEKEPSDTWVMKIIKKTETFEYFYMIDGEPFTPQCRYMENDDFGNKNCIYQP